jgi:glyoxylase-like metal-dependent hydrolase (beta-lactamase superfamily II)
MLLGLGLCAAAAQSTHAAAPQVKIQAPGFYRMMLGDFEVTALNDGVVAYPTAQVLPKATPQQIAGGLYENGLTDPVGMSYNAFLINTGDKLVLHGHAPGHTSYVVDSKGQTLIVLGDLVLMGALQCRAGTLLLDSRKLRDTPVTHIYLMGDGRTLQQPAR